MWEILGVDTSPLLLFMHHDIDSARNEGTKGSQRGLTYIQWGHKGDKMSRSIYTPSLNDNQGTLFGSDHCLE